MKKGIGYTGAAIEHEFVANVCRWCATRAHWPGASNPCSGACAKNSYMQKKATAAKKAAAKNRKRFR